METKDKELKILSRGNTFICETGQSNLHMCVNSTPHANESTILKATFISSRLIRIQEPSSHVWR